MPTVCSPAVAVRGVAVTPRRASSHTRLGTHTRPVVRRAATTATSSTLSTDVSTAKRTLLEACSGTFRGSAASSSERAAVEEAQITLEGFTGRVWDDSVSCGDAGDDDMEMKSVDLHLNLLAGKWRLLWTNANDVLSVLRLAKDSLGLLEVGDIYQSFSSQGKIENEIRIGLAGLTQPASRSKKDDPGGVALKVDANYSLMGIQSEPGSQKTNRTLALTFNEARLTELNISDLVETLLAPALLPRGGLNHQVLLALKEFDLRVPLGSAVAIGSDTSKKSDKRTTGAPVGSYHITYLDEDTLIGRANGAGGTFIFERHGEAEF